MEQHPQHPNDRDPAVPEHETVPPGEIDLTGAVAHEQALPDIDATAEAARGEIPQGGAHTLAGALADEGDDPFTGHPEAEAMAQPGPAEVAPHLDNPQVEQGLREYGDAFHAYLQLPDIDRRREDLLETFHEVYVGRYASMDALLEELTDVRDWQDALDELAGQWGIDGLVSLDRDRVEGIARQAWDIVETAGSFYAFAK
jgi:hypothetical protein